MCPERLVDLSRMRSRVPSGTWIDNGAEVINEELLALVPKKVCKMWVVFQKGITDFNFKG